MCLLITATLGDVSAKATPDGWVLFCGDYGIDPHTFDLDRVISYDKRDLQRYGMDEESVRERAAESAWGGYDFGSAVVLDENGWEFDGDEMRKVVFFENDEDPAGDSEKGHFVVRFVAGSAQVDEAYAMIDGEIVGHMPVV